MGSIGLGAFVGFIVTVILSIMYPGIGYILGGFLGGLIAGLIARGVLGGAIAGFLAGVFSAIAVGDFGVSGFALL